MFIDKLSDRFSRSFFAVRRGAKAVRRATQPPVLMEPLGQRVLLSSSYTVASSGVSLVTLAHNLLGTYDVDVYLDTSTTPTTTLTPDSTTHQITIIGQSNGLVVVDQVPAAAKDTGGILFNLTTGHSGGTLEIDGGGSDNDVVVSVVSSTTRVDTTDTSSNHGYDSIGAGVANITVLGQVSGMTFADLVAPADKASGAVFSFDSSVSPADATLYLYAQANDSLINATYTNSVRTVTISDVSSHVGTDQFGAGIAQLTVNGQRSEVKMIDAIPAAHKPANGVLFQTNSSSTNATLEIAAQSTDRKIILVGSTSSGGTIAVKDTSDTSNIRGTITITDSYTSGVKNLILRTNNAQAGTYTDVDHDGEGSLVWVEQLASPMTLLIDTGAATYATVQIGQAENSSVIGQTWVHGGAGHTAVVVTALDTGFPDIDGVVLANVDFDTGAANGLVGNTLEVGAGTTVTLAQAPFATAHRLFVDSVHVEGAVDSSTGLHVSATLIVSDPTSFSTFTANQIGVASIEAPVIIGTFDADGINSNSVRPVVTFTASANGSSVDQFSINYGMVKLDPHTSGNNTLVLTHISSIIGGQLDISNNSVIVNYTNANQLATVRGYLMAGRGPNGFGNATWNGAGGIVSAAASKPAQGLGGTGDGVNLAIGYAENSELPLGSYTTFAGQTVGTSSILIKFTRGADADLDGLVKNEDVTIVGGKFGASGSGQWYFGDFDYSGSCDNSDVTALGGLFNPSATPLGAESAVHTTQMATALARGFGLMLSHNVLSSSSIYTYWTDILEGTRLVMEQDNPDIDWSQETGTMKYVLYWTTDENWNSWSEVTLAADVTDYTITGLSSNTTYYLWVEAYTVINGVPYALGSATTT